MACHPYSPTPQLRGLKKQPYHRHVPYPALVAGLKSTSGTRPAAGGDTPQDPPSLFCAPHSRSTSSPNPTVPQQMGKLRKGWEVSYSS